MGLPAIVRKVLRLPNIDPNIKNRVLKNNDMILEILSKHMKGAKSCPNLGGNKCIGIACEHFLEFHEVDNNDSSKKRTYFKCSHVAMPDLMSELNRNIRELIGIASVLLASKGPSNNEEEKPEG